jgi:hypothetical protein
MPGGQGAGRSDTGQLRPLSFGIYDGVADSIRLDATAESTDSNAYVATGQ